MINIDILYNIDMSGGINFEFSETEDKEDWFIHCDYCDPLPTIKGSKYEKYANPRYIIPDKSEINGWFLYKLNLIIKYYLVRPLQSNLFKDYSLQLMIGSLEELQDISDEAKILLEKIKNMDNLKKLDRFLYAQTYDYNKAYREITEYGLKTSHWIWYIFPQLKGLGKSKLSEYYGIENIEEAKEFINHPILGPRLIKICQAVLNSNKSVYDIFGEDAIKVCSCCKLFAEVSNDKNSVFHKLIKKYMWN